MALSAPAISYSRTHTKYSSETRKLFADPAAPDPNGTFADYLPAGSYPDGFTSTIIKASPPVT